MSDCDALETDDLCRLGVEVGHEYCEQCGDCLVCYAGEPCVFGGEPHEPTTAVTAAEG